MLYEERFFGLEKSGWEAPSDMKAIGRLAIAGMGGSIIAGMVAKDYTGMDIAIINGYDFPSWLKSGTLIASSYSGNTEETLLATRKAAKLGMKIIVISSGGRLERMSKRNKWPFIQMPEGLQPREALPFSLFSILRIISNSYGLNEREVRKAMKVRPGKSGIRKAAKRLYGRIPFVLSFGFLSSAGYRFKTQLNENAKVPAFYEEMSESNHNTMMAMESKLFDDLVPVFIRDRSEGRIGDRYDAMKKMGWKAMELHSEGKCRLERIISIVLKGDLISYELAKLYGKDPEEVRLIKKLKNLIGEKK